MIEFSTMMELHSDIFSVILVYLDVFSAIELACTNKKVREMVKQAFPATYNRYSLYLSYANRQWSRNDCIRYNLPIESVQLEDQLPPPFLPENINTLIVAEEKVMRSVLSHHKSLLQETTRVIGLLKSNDLYLARGLRFLHLNIDFGKEWKCNIPAIDGLVEFHCSISVQNDLACLQLAETDGGVILSKSLQRLHVNSNPHHVLVSQGFRLVKTVTTLALKNIILSTKACQDISTSCVKNVTFYDVRYNDRLMLPFCENLSLLPCLSSSLLPETTTQLHTFSTPTPEFSGFYNKMFVQHIQHLCCSLDSQASICHLTSLLTLRVAILCCIGDSPHIYDLPNLTFLEVTGDKCWIENVPNLTHLNLLCYNAGSKVTNLRCKFPLQRLEYYEDVYAYIPAKHHVLSIRNIIPPVIMSCLEELTIHSYGSFELNKTLPVSRLTMVGSFTVTVEQPNVTHLTVKKCVRNIQLGNWFPNLTSLHVIGGTSVYLVMPKHPIEHKSFLGSQVVFC